MALANKFSNTADSTPHLVPGQIGINRVDETLWLRAEGKAVPLSITKLRTTSAPAGGRDGVPLRKGETIAWANDLAPASVVGGDIKVDYLPDGLYGIPGVHITGQGSSTVYAADDVVVMAFDVASDAIQITAALFYVNAAPSGDMRVGIVNAEDEIVLDSLVTPTAGSNVVSGLDVALPRGAYRAVMWTEAEIDVSRLLCLRVQQGWDYGVGEDPEFIRSELGSAALDAGLDLSGAGLAPQTSATPGLDHHLMFTWVHV